MFILILGFVNTVKKRQLSEGWIIASIKPIKNNCNKYIIYLSDKELEELKRRVGYYG